VGFVLIAYFAYDAAYQDLAEVGKVWLPRVEPSLLAHGLLPKDTTGVAKFTPAPWEAAGDAVAHVTTPEDRIQCWAYLPGVYLRARRINACRFTTWEKIGQVAGGAQFVEDELRDTLVKNPPAALVIPSGDYFWTYEPPPGSAPVTAPAVADAASGKFRYGPWILANYRLAAEVCQSSETYYIFKRKDLWHPTPEENLDERLEEIHAQAVIDHQRRRLKAG
jgi:hypothetical protein